MKSINVYIKAQTTGLWITIVVLAGLLFIPLGISMETAKNLAMPLLFGLGYSIQLLVRQNKLKTNPHLVMDAREIRCLPAMGKAWAVMLDQVETLSMNDKLLTIQRGGGGKKYVVPLKPLTPENRAMVQNWVDEWSQTTDRGQ